MVLFHLFFLLQTTILPKDMVLFHFFFLLCTTIWLNILGHIDLLFLFTHNHSTKIHGPLSFVLSFCTIIWPKLRVLINLFLLFVHDHSTKIKGHSYSSIILFLIVPIFRTLIRGSTAPVLRRLYSCQYCLIFRTLYSWLYEAFAKLFSVNGGLRSLFLTSFNLTGWKNAQIMPEPVLGNIHCHNT